MGLLRSALDRLTGARADGRLQRTRRSDLLSRLSSQRDLGAALALAAGGRAGEARPVVERVTAHSPGLALPDGARPSAAAARSLLEAMPDNLSVLWWHAQACEAGGSTEEARKRYIEVIRRLRGPADAEAAHDAGQEADVRARCGDQPIWHSIDLGTAFIEGRRKSSAVLAQEMLRANLPDMTGSTVLDVGAWGGWFSFEAERRGAQVTALDYYSWVTDFSRLHQWMEAERAAGRAPDAYAPPPHVFDAVAQPGRRPFDLAHQALGSRVRALTKLFEDLDPATDGTFEVVLHLGVLYHCRDPFLTLRKLAAMTQRTALVETLGVLVPGCVDEPLWEFVRSDRVNRDQTTWWAPSEVGLLDALLAAGFRHAEITYGYEDLADWDPRGPQLCRLWALAQR